MDFTKYKNPGYKNTNTSQAVCVDTIYSNHKKRMNICTFLFSHFISLYDKYVQTS
jgi:hypothetical protein